MHKLFFKKNYKNEKKSSKVKWRRIYCLTRAAGYSIRIQRETPSQTIGMKKPVEEMQETVEGGLHSIHRFTVSSLFSFQSQFVIRMRESVLHDNVGSSTKDRAELYALHRTYSPSPSPSSSSTLDSGSTVSPNWIRNIALNIVLIS